MNPESEDVSRAQEHNSNNGKGGEENREEEMMNFVAFCK